MIQCRLLTLGLLTLPSLAAAEDIRFRKTVLSTTFYSEGCAVGDFNKDGRLDVVAGPCWYQQPQDWGSSWPVHQIREPGTFKWDGGYSESFVNGAIDVNQDGWTDIIIAGFPGRATLWYENPQDKSGRWKEHAITPWTCNESPQIVDVNKDGRLDLLYAFTPDFEERGWMAWSACPSSKEGSGGGNARGRLRWHLHPISKAKAPCTHRFAHGLGFGDMNGDGHGDVICPEGWWENPGNPETPDWPFHSAQLGEACADMYPFDVDGDGDMDVISSSAHKYGIWWHEQGSAKSGSGPDSKGEPTWTKHEIYMKVSQTHALQVADINADGQPDLVTGKRYWAHNGHDPGAREPAVLMWFEFRREGGRPTWTPHEIDHDSGIGTQFVVTDINNDKKLDIVTSNKKGTFVFTQE